MVQGTNQAMNVPAEAGKLRLWRNTSMATLAAGTNGTLPRGVLGYEYDVDVDNGFRPAGLFDLSSTTNTENEVAAGLRRHRGAGHRDPQPDRVPRRRAAPSCSRPATVQWS